jgi:tetratricopeptide (TPR) repeat protein
MVLALVALVAMASLAPALGLAAAGTTAPAAAANGQEATKSVGEIEGDVSDLSAQLDDVASDGDTTRTIENVILTPVALLVSILAAGGILGVVYSVRDQRRTSQLHELTVSGEIASQRRSEQSYGSFLEQSQTTLSLVNDTLELAKEATDRAAHSMELKAQSRVDAIEERAQRLMLDVFGEREFELIINDATRRDELHSIAADLRSLEGYLSLQDIKLRQNTKFVKAIDQFLLDDTEAAIQALRLASQDRVTGELQRFVEYWLGYMLTTVGEYDEAVGKFRHDEIDLKEDDPEYFQLERIIDETEFFAIAKEVAQVESSRKGKKKATPPQERFKKVAKLLDRLAKLAAKLETSESQSAKHHTSLEITRTRADIYEWIAYDPSHLDERLKKKPIAECKKIVRRHPEAKKIAKARKFPSTGAWKELRNPDAFRTWALMQARQICEEERERNLDVEFALAECLFKLRSDKADGAFERAELALHNEFGELHEKRRLASIHQSALICHSRLLKLRRGKKQQRRAESRQVIQASREALDVVREMRQGKVTVFSQIQRRNISQADFKEEIDEIVKQVKIREEDE